MFRIIGGIVGFFMGSIFWLPGMIIGAFIGASLGGSVDTLLFGSRNNYRSDRTTEDAYRKFYEQFYNQSQNASYANNGQRYSYNDNPYTGVSDTHYANIGCSRTDSNDVIKKQYRKLVAQYHPDRIAGKGYSQVEMDAAEAKFKRIQESYNLIKKEKGL